MKSTRIIIKSNKVPTLTLNQSYSFIRVKVTKSVIYLSVKQRQQKQLKKTANNKIKYVKQQQLRNKEINNKMS